MLVIIELNYLGTEQVKSLRILPFRSIAWQKAVHGAWQKAVHGTGHRNLDTPGHARAIDRWAGKR
jgi:hypothetical protein